MHSMKFLLASGIVLVMLLAGCTSSPAKPKEEAKAQECTTIKQEIPETKEKCGEISLTSQVCASRKLQYSLSPITKIDICLGSEACSGKPLAQCNGCSKALTRCILNVTNKDNKSGAWKVDAIYTINNHTFSKDPISREIRAGESFGFDFSQNYAGDTIDAATCDLRMLDEPSLEDCHQETKQAIKCENVTTVRTVEKQVCK